MSSKLDELVSAFASLDAFPPSALPRLRGLLEKATDHELRLGDCCTDAEGTQCLDSPSGLREKFRKAVVPFAASHETSTKGIATTIKGLRAQGSVRRLGAKNGVLVVRDARQWEQKMRSEEINSRLEAVWSRLQKLMQTKHPKVSQIDLDTVCCERLERFLDSEETFRELDRVRFTDGKLKDAVGTVVAVDKNKSGRMYRVSVRVDHAYLYALPDDIMSVGNDEQRILRMLERL